MCCDERRGEVRARCCVVGGCCCDGVLLLRGSVVVLRRCRWLVCGVLVAEGQRDGSSGGLSGGDADQAERNENKEDEPHADSQPVEGGQYRWQDRNDMDRRGTGKRADRGIWTWQC